MEFESFSLKNREEVEIFENLLAQYTKQRAQFALSHISLTSVYDTIQQREEGARIFAAILDIQINFTLLYCDLHVVGAISNNPFSEGEMEGCSVLYNPDEFYRKMDIHRFNSSYILRYRAMWDKLMGLFILLYAPQEYDRFCGSKSKKKSFRKILYGVPQIPEDFVLTIENMLQKFDNEFRTAEAHGTGILRKYSFAMGSMHQNPQLELIWYWNTVNHFISIIGDMLKQNKNEE